MTTHPDLDARARDVIDGNRYMVLGTLDSSGRPRVSPVYFTHDGNVILIASQTGRPKHPAWFHNLQANPEVELWAGGGGGAYRAREAEGDERDRLWRLATQLYPGYDDYQLRADAAGRRIPVVVCEPLDQDG